MKIVFTGGGTIGPVVPLLAIHNDLLEDAKDYQSLWIGTFDGPEYKIIKENNIKFKKVHSGKWRRYFSLYNILTIPLTVIGIIQSFVILRKFRPDVVISASAYVSVPVVLASYVLGIKNIILQQDVTLSLTNKILTPFVDKIVVSHESSLKDFPKNKTVWTGQPLLKKLFNVNKEEALKHFKLKNNLPIVLITGGGTGACSINKLVAESINELLCFCQIIHITGTGKQIKFNINKELKSNYHGYEFLANKMPEALNVSNIVVSRAGAATISEILALNKPSIIVPLPNTQQETNADVLTKEKVSIVLKEEVLTKEVFISNIKNLLEDKEKQEELKNNSKRIFKKDGTKNIIKEIYNLL